MIDPNAIPIPKADPDAVEDAGGKLKNDGTAIAQTGDDIHSDWQGLNKFYKAPHEELLYAATAPIAAAGHDFKGEITTVGNALVTFAGEIRPLITRLQTLKGDAQQFRSDIAGDDDWRKDEDKVEEHNQLNDDILAAIAQYQEAERECANKITSIFGGTRFVPADGDPKSGEKGYGLGDVPEGIETPWAKPQEYDAPWYEDAWNGVKDFTVGLVTDIADMVGIHGENGWVWEGDSHFWDNLKNNWMGALEDTAGLVGLHGENGWVWEGDSHFWDNLKHNWTEVAHSFVPWREWGDRPGYVITSSILNIGSIFVGVGAVRAGIKLIKRGDVDSPDSPDGPDRTHGDHDGDGRLDSDEVGFGDNPSTTDLQNQLDDLDIDTGDLRDSLDDMDDLQDVPDREPAHVGGDDGNGQNPEGPSNGGDSGDGPSGSDSPTGDTTPDGGDTSPDGGDTTPDGGDTTPDGGDTTPDDGDANPEGGGGDADDAPHDSPSDGGGHVDPVPEVVDDVPPPRTDGPTYPTTPLNDRWRGEDEPGNPIWRNDGVEYLDAEQREQRRIWVDDQGLIRDVEGRLFDTTRGRTVIEGGGQGRAIFVMDRLGNIYASNFQKVGQFHHSSFLSGGPVAAAGELRVVDGKLEMISDRSGHYVPAPEFKKQMVEMLRNAGVKVTDDMIKGWDG